jgi:excinuclease ABC subunit C
MHVARRLRSSTILAWKTRQPKDWSVMRRHAPADAAMVAGAARIEAVSCDSVHEAAWLERNLLEASLPPWNRTAGGQESAIYIRLDTMPRAPGLSAVYRADPAGQVRYFGPYLGGLRVRQAIAALHRLLPVSYAKARLVGAERDMARIRGVARDDRGELISSLTAILDREPDAVGWARDQLEQHRDRAAWEQGYELAARIQQEIAALEWITCSQRVTTMDGADLTVCGWSGGMLVQFQIRGGRVCRWSQRSCSFARAAGILAATPATWSDFMRHNAELAASLAERST